MIAARLRCLPHLSISKPRWQNSCAIAKALNSCSRYGLIFIRIWEEATMREPDADFLTLIESEKEIEVFPGRFDRRYFLRGSLAIVAAVIAARTLSGNVFAQA